MPSRTRCLQATSRPWCWLATQAGALNDYEASTVEGIVETTPSARAAQEQSAAQDARTLDTDLRNYARLASPGQDTTDYHSVQAQWAMFKTANGPLLSSTVRESPATSALVLKLDTQNLTPLQTLVASWSGVNQKVAAAGSQTSASTYSSARTLGIGLLVLAIAVGLAIAFLLSSSIKRGVDVVLDRLRSLQDDCATYVREGLEAFASGDLTKGYEPVTAVIDNPSRMRSGRSARR